MYPPKKNILLEPAAGIMYQTITSVDTNITSKIIAAGGFTAVGDETGGLVVAAVSVGVGHR